MWLNKEVVYDSEKHIYLIYTTEDRIEESKKKLYNYLKKECKERLSKAQKEMGNIEKLGEELFGGSSNEKTHE